jgi:pimeloyl-ACP methyl ester carboxylesterase
VRLGRPAYLIDLPGHGRSDRPTEFDYSLPAMAAVMAIVIEHLAAGPVDVVSHSVGGSIAIVLADARPELVRHSVLVEPAIDPVPIEPGSIAHYSDAEILAGGWEDVLAAELDWRRCDMRLADPLAIVRLARHLSDAMGDSVHARLRDTTVPTTLVRGDLRDYARLNEYVQEGIADVRIADAQHFVMHDQPEAFVGVLRAALS